SLAAAGHSVADFVQGRQRPPSFSSCATIRSSWVWSQASPGAQIPWIAKPELLIDPGLAKLGKQRRYFAQIVDIGHLGDQIGGTHKARIVAGAAMLFVLREGKSGVCLNLHRIDVGQCDLAESLAHEKLRSGHVTHAGFISFRSATRTASEVARHN